jgi:hypothetical protein
MNQLATEKHSLFEVAENRIHWLLAPAIFYSVAILSAVFFLDVRGSPDGDREMKLARLLPEADWLPWRFLEITVGVTDEAHSVLNFLVYDYFLGILNVLAGDNWRFVHGLASGILIAATLTVCAFVLMKIKASKLTLLFFWLFGFAGWHLGQWAFVITSEPIYTLEISVLILLLVSLFEHKSSIFPWKLAALILLMCGVIFISRPTSPPIISVALGLLFLCWIGFGKNAEHKQHVVRVGAVLFVALLLAVMLVGTIFLANPDMLPEGTSLRRAYVEYYSPYVNNGNVVWHRPEFFVAKGSGYLHSLYVVFLRLPMFFWFLADNYSTGHKIINALYYPILYLCVLFATWLGLSNKNNLSDGLLTIVWIGIPLVLAVDAFHAFTLLDFNWRYRTPTYPALYMIASIGAAELSKRLWLRFRHR